MPLPEKIATIADVEALEASPYEQVVPVSTMYQLLQRSAELYPDRPALTYEETGDPDNKPVTYSYRALFDHVRQAANLFHDLGIGENGCVAMLMPNIPEGHFTLWGAEIAGRICPINYLLNTEHIIHLINASEAKILVALGPDPDLNIFEKLDTIRASCPGLNAILTVDAPNAGDNDFMARLREQPADHLTFDREITKDTIAACFHTGGTTGAPKLAQHRHGNQVHTSWSAQRMFDWGPDDTIINGFPLFHVAGSFVYGSAMFLAGGNTVLATRVGLRHTGFMANYWRFVEKHKVTILGGVPANMTVMLNTPRDEVDISSARALITGGTPLPSELAKTFEADLAVPVRNVLGMTESAGLLSIQPFHGERVVGSTGLRLPYTDVKIVPLGAEGPDLPRECATGETGVIIAKGPHISPGYTEVARNEGTFSNAGSEDGWLISGDLGHIDDAGNIFVTGRSKDVIIRGAHNIDPSSIEEVVDQHPAVEMSAAIGQPDAYAGELPVVYVTLKPGQTATEEELLSFIEPRIAERPAMPKRAHVLDELPLTAVGKIYKPTLRLQSVEEVFNAVLEPLRGEGADITVEGADNGGRLSILLVMGEEPSETTQESIKAHLRDFSIPWEIEVR